MSPVKVLALLLLMFASFFLVGQYQKQFDLSKLPNLITPLPSSNAKVAGITIQAETPLPLPTASPTAVFSPSPMQWILPSPPQTSHDQGSDFIYPGATVSARSGVNITLQSADSPANITNWYEDKLKSLGFNATNFIKTNSNEDILNSLVSGKNGREVRVEIKKNTDSSIVIINLEIK